MTDERSLGCFAPPPWPSRAQAEYITSLLAGYVEMALRAEHYPAEVMLTALELLETWAVAHGLDDPRTRERLCRAGARTSHGSGPRHGGWRRVLRGLLPGGSR